MTRTWRNKLLYLLVVMLLAGGSMYLLAVTRQPVSVWVLLALAFLLPGRIQGYFWRDFFRGRRLLGTSDFPKAEEHFESFLAQIARKPWLKRLIWLSWGMYTRDTEAMTLNNLGACKLESGSLEEAEKFFRKAVSLDPQFAIPYFNLALLAQLRGDAPATNELTEKARSLGYTQSTVDRLVHEAGSLLARLEGRGT